MNYLDFLFKNECLGTILRAERLIEPYQFQVDVIFKCLNLNAFLYLDD